MNQITDPPQSYGAGLEFNYAVWTADTVLTLCNVSWGNDYRDIVKFPNRTELNAYIDGLTTTKSTINNASYAPIGRPIKIEMPFNAAMRYNYIRASNPLMPVNGDIQRDYYYFILDVRYVTPSVTEIIVEIDVWQTFGYEVSFGNCYIERGHIGIAASNAYDSFGSTYLTVPEGLDAGSEYRTVAHRQEQVIENPAQATITGDSASVIVVSSTRLFGQRGTENAPKIEIGSGAFYAGSTTGLNVYFFESVIAFSAAMETLKAYPWIVQGIQSITLAPRVTRYHPYASYGTRGVISLGEDEAEGALGRIDLNAGADYYPAQLSHSLWNNWRQSSELLNNIPARYRHLKKFLTFPYTSIEMTTWNGSAITLKPEAWKSADATVIERANIVPPGQRITFYPRAYNTSVKPMDERGDDGGEFLDMAVNIDQFPQLPIPNDNGALTLAQNARGIAHSKDSANWDSQRTMQANTLAVNQARMARDLATDQTRESNMNSSVQTAYNNAVNMDQAVVQGIAGIGQGAIMGGVAGPAGMGIGALGGAVNMIPSILSASNESRRASNLNRLQGDHATRMTNMSNDYGAAISRSNYELAERAREGDYANNIAGIDARVQDMQTVAPSVTGQFGGEALNFRYNNVEVALRWKMVGESAMRRIGEYWLRYGYAIHLFGTLPSSLMVMSNFTYWKLSETYISAANMPEGFKRVIRGIFERGVTVWSDPAKIGNTDLADNTPLAGVTL